MEGGGDVCTFLAPTLRSLSRGFCIFVTYLGTPALSLPFSPFSVRAPPRSCLCPPSVRPAPRVPARSDRATPWPPLCMESSAKMESGGAGPQPQQPFLPPAACFFATAAAQSAQQPPPPPPPPPLLSRFHRVRICATP